MRFNTRSIAQSAIIGAAYASLTMALAPISYGAVQFRISEALCILPFFLPASAWGLYFGCMAANLISAAGIPDVVFGSLATLFAALCTARIGIQARRENEGTLQPAMSQCLLACAMPVLFNGPIIGAVLAYAFTPESFWAGFALFSMEVAVGEAVVMFALGLPLMRMLPKLGAHLT